VYLKAWADEKAKRVYLSIRDEGMGMDQHQRELLIKGEVAVDSLSGTLNEQGTGIGMVIVRDFLKENNSSFDIESQLNEGTNFILNMPLGKKVNYKPSSNLKSVYDFL
jgi:signal transduction histidine kinase